ncbi:integrase catalytic domain-containing protein [Trichonephila clavipes]|nr:integrase catalytic domain-containing protein [Trichonephila clavipes]
MIEEFKNSMKILPDGRYELCLPFKSEAIDFSSNKDLTWKRHIKMCERAQRNGILDDYKVVFKEWEELYIYVEIIEKVEEKGEEIVYCHCRVVFGVSSSPFLLAAVLAHLLENAPADDTPLGSKLKLSFYVDNCVTGVNDIAQQEEFILRSKEILSRGCFNLRNWESNVESKHISKSTGTTKLLGIIWDLDKDTLKCKIDFKSLSGETKITQRLILATVQKIFDPIGMLCSVTVTPKILLQNTWKLKLAWDSSLPEEIVKPFFKWWNEIKILSDVKIPRYFENNDSTQMHVFVDACKEAYATCIFFRSNTSQGVKVALVRAKARVAPLKQVTISRLELMVCCIGERLAHSVQESLNITEMETVFWSDSMVALYWLREKGGCHVPGKINPTDLISRGCSPSHLVESHWWEGPLWLVESPDTWPKTKLPDYDTSEISLERKKVKLCNLNLSEEMLPWYARKFSKFHSILSLVAWLRFINNVRSRISDRKKGKLSLDELKSAEIQLIRSVPAQSFTDEKLISNLSVFRDENNIIRVKTRITERIDEPNFLSSILLPNTCGRRTVRKIWFACVKCRRFKIKSPMTDPVSLPSDRIKDAVVFEVVGVDLAGPCTSNRVIRFGLSSIPVPSIVRCTSN